MWWSAIQPTWRETTNWPFSQGDPAEHQDWALSRMVAKMDYLWLLSVLDGGSMHEIYWVVPRLLMP